MASRNALKIFVGNLPWTIGRRELREHFLQFGDVAAATVIFNKETGTSRGYGYVVFSSKDGKINATREKSQFLEGNFININEPNFSQLDDKLFPRKTNVN